MNEERAWALDVFQRQDQILRLQKYHPLEYPKDYEIANCGCVHHAEDGIPCPHAKPLRP